MSTDFDLLGTDVIEAFGETITIKQPIDGPLDPLTGKRQDLSLVATVEANVARSQTERLDNEVPEEIIEMAVRVSDVAFEVTTACVVRIHARDRSDQFREITAVPRVCGGTMYQLTTSRML